MRWRRCRALGALGTALIVGAANALNMYIERDIDGLAPRTKEASAASWASVAAGCSLLRALAHRAGASSLAICANLLTAFWGSSPLRFISRLYPDETDLAGGVGRGAIPGAMPPLMGWTAATGQLDLGGITLFAILFLWQLPRWRDLAVPP